MAHTDSSRTHLPGSDRHRGRSVGGLVIGTLLTVVGVGVGLFCFFVCQGMFSGYPQHRTDVLSHLGLVLISATGGVAWIVDHRRIDDDD